MGHILTSYFILLLLIPLSITSCHDRKAPELSVRDQDRIEPSADSNPQRSDSPQDNANREKTPAVKPQPDPDRDSGETRSDPDRDSEETRTGLLVIGNIQNFNGKEWVAALVKIKNAETGSIKVAETVPNQSTPYQYKLPYGSYLLSLEYFADTAKTQILARSCAEEQSRVHLLKEDVYNPEIMICWAEDTVVTPADAEVIIRPIVVRP